MTAPGGCTLSGNTATCDFATWSPPLLDTQFTRSPSKVILQDVDGNIPSGAFGGLTNADNNTSPTPEIALQCGFSNAQFTLTLLADSFSSNLDWVQHVTISDCYNMDIAANAFSALTSVTWLTFLAGSFATLSSAAFSSMASLQTLNLLAEMPISGVPSGLFDGLASLTSLDMSSSTMYSLPSGVFDTLKNLETLSLRRTGLTTLPTDLFLPLLTLDSLDLSLNDWVCNCFLEWLEEYLTSTGLAAQATCGSPTEYAGYDLQRSIQALNCTTTTTTDDDEDSDGWRIYVYVLIAATAMALIIATIAMLCCFRNHQQLQQYLNNKAPKPHQNGPQDVGWYLPPSEKNNSGVLPPEKKHSGAPQPDRKHSGAPPPYASREEVGNEKFSSHRIFQTTSSRRVSPGPRRAANTYRAQLWE